MAPEAVLDPHFTRTTWLECFASFVFDTLHFAFCWPWRELSPWWYAAFSDTYPFKCQKMSGNCFSPLSSASRPAFKVLQIAPLLCPRSCSYHPHAVEWPKAKTSISVYYIYILYNIYIYSKTLAFLRLRLNAAHMIFLCTGLKPSMSDGIARRTCHRNRSNLGRNTKKR